jgi:hypothetical protein
MVNADNGDADKETRRFFKLLEKTAVDQRARSSPSGLRNYVSA